MSSAHLQVKEAQGHGRSLARLSLETMRRLKVDAGDIVALEGGRQTHARVVPASGVDAQTIELSATSTVNIGAACGSSIKVEAVTLSPLASVVLRATQTKNTVPDDLNEALFDLPLTKGDRITIPLRFGASAEFEVVGLSPSAAGLFSDQTTLSLATPPDKPEKFADIGGLKDQIARVHEMVATPLLRPDLFERLKVPAPRGVLFTGPPGSGKTLLARSVAAKTSAAFFQINGPEIVSKHYGESEAALRDVFDAASQNPPAIVFIDEIDAIAPRRDSLSGEKQLERRVVAQLLTLMDGMAERGQVVVMAATNLPDSLDPALRRPGRFDREIHFAPPDAEARRDILEIHLREAPLSHDVDLAHIAQLAHGYVGADLAALAREASLGALDRAVTTAGSEQALDPDTLFITPADLYHGLSKTSPSALRDTGLSETTVTFDDIGGMEEPKKALKEAIILPFKHRESYTAFRLQAVSGVLLCGPPGGGKTLLAQGVATQSGMNFIPVRPARLLSQFLGEAERAIAEIFAKARQSAPCLLFFDELDALVPQRSEKDPTLNRIVAQMLTELDGMAPNTDVVILAASNRPDAIDPALIRPGRFDEIIHIPLPDCDARCAILGIHTRSLPLSTSVDLQEIASTTAGHSGADLALIVQSAARIAVRRHLTDPGCPREVASQDFHSAIARMQRADTLRRTNFLPREEQK